MSKNDLYKQAEEQWGMFFQTLMVIEESAELTMELAEKTGLRNMQKQAEKLFKQCKLIRNGYVSDELKMMRYGVSDNLVEEIADVEIMLDQLKHMHNITGKVEWQKAEKLVRLNDMLGNTHLTEQTP